jgi:tRNA U34 5-carboxymethylaminomethyl modifying GTPase MnmE/TrmE
MQKLELTDPYKAIMNDKNAGPIFGKGHDIFISDKCNEGKTSLMNYPWSYSYSVDDILS